VTEIGKGDSADERVIASIASGNIDKVKSSRRTSTASG
jgi:hypothetical protein